MPFALTFVGILLIVTGFQNTYQQFGKLVAGDFTGQPNFFTWFLAIGIIGGIGYYKPLEKPSRLFLGLVIAVLIISQKTGFFDKLNSQLQQGAQPADQLIGAPLPVSGSAGSSGGSSGGGGGGSSGLAQVAQIAEVAAILA